MKGENPKEKKWSNVLCNENVSELSNQTKGIYTRNGLPYEVGCQRAFAISGYIDVHLRPLCA